jgi:hypothetical protein
MKSGSAVLENAKLGKVVNCEGGSGFVDAKQS